MNGGQPDASEEIVKELERGWRERAFAIDPQQRADCIV